MLTWLKTASLIAAIAVSLGSPRWGIPSMLATFLLLAAVSGAAPREVLRRNLFIVSFALIFSALALFSGAVSGRVPYRDIARDFAMIILVYNCVAAGARWIGREGAFRLIAALPSVRARIFLLLFARIHQSLTRSHRGVMDHLRSRLALKAGDRLIVARYYVQNLMEKEMHAHRYHQAAVLSRITAEPALLWKKEEVAAADIAAIALTGLIAAAAALAG